MAQPRCTSLDVIHHAERLVNQRLARELAEKNVELLMAHPHVRRLVRDKAELMDLVARWQVLVGCSAPSAGFHPPPPEGTRDIAFNASQLDLGEKETYKLMARGEILGVFQLESSGSQELLKKLKPDCFEDVVAAVALYRPGPLQTGMVDDFIN